MQTMSPAYRELLDTDFDGNSPPADGEGVDGVILDGLEDERRQERVAGLLALAEDEQHPPRERYHAVSALAAWAEPAGLRAVVAAARQGSAVPWFKADVHRLWGCDVTFEGLAQCLTWGDDLAVERGTADLRREAVRALLDIADAVYFESYLVSLLTDLTREEVAALDAVIGRAVTGLQTGRRPDFPLPAQVADLSTVLVRYDEPAAVAHARAVAAFGDFGTRALSGLAGIVAHGTGPESARFAEELRAAAGPTADEHLESALAARGARATGSSRND